MRYLSTLSSKLLRSLCKSRKLPIRSFFCLPQESSEDDDDVPKIDPPPVKETPTAPADKNNVGLDGGVEVNSGFSIGVLIFGFIFVAGCATLSVRFKGWERVSRALGFGKHRYRRVGDTDLEQ